MPQSSIQGLYLFNAYLNDIVKINYSVTFLVDADDTSIFFSDGYVNDLVDIANNTLRFPRRMDLDNKCEQK